MDTRYYEHLKYSYDITWNDISDKEEKTLLETQMKVAKMMTESTNRKINNEKKRQHLMKLLYILTLYHKILTSLIQGNENSAFVIKEFPIHKAVSAIVQERTKSTNDLSIQLNLRNNKCNFQRTGIAK